jgi:hypothetical protein
MERTPFDTIESAEEFLQLLRDEAAKAQAEIEALLDGQDQSARRVEAIRLVVHKLVKLQSHTESSQRILRDLKTLRKLLLREFHSQ